MLLQVYPIDPKACAKMVGVVNKVYILLVTEMHVLTEIKKNLFSLTAPKHPTIATMMTTTPAAIIRPGTIT